MSSRYPTIRPVDYCFNPVHVVDKASDKDIIVPCGKCDGCLLHKANEWAMRCGMEIEDTPATIFFTLTYDNKYLPKLVLSQNMRLVHTGNSDVLGLPINFPCDLVLQGNTAWYSDNPYNVRFNGVRDVLRDDGIVISHSYHVQYLPIPLSNWDNDSKPVIAYASKRDIQLWLKLLRKDLYNHGFYPEKRVLQKGVFRYYYVSEIGPTTFRPHGHGLLFCQSREIAQYLLEGSLYQNWQMCSQDRFDRYAHLCDSGARGYVTQYLTSYSDLPKVYREVKEIRPFRLASKSPAIGYVLQIKEKIFEDVSRGVIQYRRPVIRLESDPLLLYPSGFMSSLFPKCFRFNKISDNRRFSVYNYIYAEVRRNGRFPSVLLPRLSKVMQSQDFLASCACYRFCCEYIDSPSHYYYLLDTYYYKLAMFHLKSFYESQQKCDFRVTPELIFEYYPNIEVICNNPNLKDVPKCLNFLSDFGFDVRSLLGNRSFFLSVRMAIKKRNSFYRKEVQDIISNMEKMPKFNELTGDAPTIV